MQFSIYLIVGVSLLFNFSLSHDNSKPNILRSPLSQQSHTEEFVGVSKLFDIMTSVDSKNHAEWTVFTFPVDILDLVHMQRFKKNAEPDLAAVGSIAGINCTVIYMNQCTSWNKCRSNCRSFGASGYRWFHDGCCECVGSTCLNNGVNESRCKYCPEPLDDDDDEVNWNGETNWQLNNGY